MLDLEVSVVRFKHSVKDATFHVVTPPRVSNDGRILGKPKVYKSRCCNICGKRLSKYNPNLKCWAHIDTEHEADIL